jgi:LAGLIDADG DNA endonuclease family
VLSSFFFTATVLQLDCAGVILLGINSLLVYNLMDTLEYCKVILSHYISFVTTLECSGYFVACFGIIRPLGIPISKIRVSPYQMQAIAGLMLGDGNLRNPNAHKRNTGNFRLEFTFKESVLDFIIWLKFIVLKGLVTSTLPTPYPKENPTQYWFSSRNMPMFTTLDKIWYVSINDQRIKILPSNAYLKEYFTEVALAFLIMGDGYWDKHEQTVFIATENFTQADIMRLVSFLKERFDLIVTTKRRKLKNGYGYRLRFSRIKENVSKLRRLVAPHMHPCMLYKLGPLI